MTDGDLRTDLEAATLAELERVGLEGLNRSRLVRSFAGRGPSVRTLYRMLADFIDSGRAGQQLARRLEAAVSARAARTTDPATEAAHAAVAAMPRSIDVCQIAGTGPLQIMDHLQLIMQNAIQVMEYAKTEDGKVRNAKLLLMACGNLRQSIETALRVAESLNSIAEVERFHAILFEELRQETPECAERVLVRIERVMGQFGATA